MHIVNTLQNKKKTYLIYIEISAKVLEYNQLYTFPYN